MEPERWQIDSGRAMWEVLDGEAVIVDLASGHYHAANGVALDVWLAIDAGASYDDIFDAAVDARADVPADASEQIAAFIADLATRGLVGAHTGHGPDRGVPPTSGSAVTNDERGAWARPALESYDDLEDLLLLDPVHDVTAEGWPHAALDAPTTGSPTPEP